MYKYVSCRVNTQNGFNISAHPCIKGLLTECEVYTGKYLLRFSYRTTKERGLYEILSRTDRANEVNKTFITWLLVHFLLSLQRCVRLQMLPFTLPYPLVSWSRCMFTLVRHSFASLIDKQLSRKATVMFQDVLSFELFQRTLPNPFLFSFKSIQKFKKTQENLKVPISYLGILHICNLCILLRKIVIYLVGRKFYLRRIVCS